MHLRFWREPLIHFFVLGLVVFSLHWFLEKKPETPEDPYLVEVTSADIEWFRTMWNKRMGREPDVNELRGEVNQLIREQILSREAVSMGLDQGDTVVRRRLAQKMNYLFKDLSDIEEPADDELKAYLQNNRKKYEIPGTASLTHIYFNTDKRGEEEAREATRKLVEKLKKKEGSIPDLSTLGDPFLLDSDYKNKDLVEIRGIFGQKFAEAVWSQKPGTWHGPVASGYGVHAVYLHERSDARLPDYRDLKERLRSDWMGDKQRELSRRVYKELRGKYRVLLEGLPYDLDISG